MRKNFKSAQYSILLVIIISIAWMLQLTLFTNTDVSWLLEASKRMLAGGSYTNDYFENNPPWILYFYALPVLAAKLFSAHVLIVIRIFVFLLAGVSLSFCYYFFQRIFAKQDALLVKALTLTLAMLFLVLPLAEFGQREHLLFILSMPYFLLVTLRLQGQQVNSCLAFSVGLLAGSVFLFKPYFLMALFLVELYYLINKKTLWAWIRPETTAIAFLLLVYAAILFLRHPDYLSLIMPFALRWCYLGTRNPWIVVVNNTFTQLCCLSILLCIITYEMHRYRQFMWVMLLAFLGFFFSYLIQQESWYYHLLPAYALAILINVSTFYFYITTPDKKKHILISTACFFILAVLLLYKMIDSFSHYVFFHPVAWVCFTVGVFVLCGSFFIGRPWVSAKQFTFIYLLAMLMFLLPYFDSLLRYEMMTDNKRDYQQLVDYMDKKAQHESVYFFTTNIAHAFPVVSYSKSTTSASRFSFFWALPGLVHQTYMGGADNEQHEKDKNFLIDKVTEDIAAVKPKLVFIDALTQKNTLRFWDPSTLVITFFPFDYLKYFNKNQKFQQIWQNYRYLTTLTSYRKSHINPALYKIQLSSHHVPLDADILEKKIYLYLRNNGDLELAFKNDGGEVQRIKIQDKKFQGIKQQLLTGASFDKSTQQLFYAWAAQQVQTYPFYKFDVYERRSDQS